jgi:hypothetical protein
MASLGGILDEIKMLLEIPEAELSEEQRAELEAYLDDLAQAKEDKVDDIGYFITSMTMRIKGINEHAAMLSKKANAASVRIERLKTRYKENMLAAGITKISGSVYDMSLRKSTSVSVTSNIDALHDVFKRTKTIVEPDKNKIKEALKAGVEIEGCEIVTNYSLQIK